MTPGEWLAGSSRWRRWSPARKLLFCYFVPFQFAFGFIVASIVGVVLACWAGLIQ